MRRASPRGRPTVGGVPRDPETLGDTGDGEVCDHDPFQRPPQPGARELRAWLRRGAGVLAPHVSAVGTAVAAHYNFQPGRSPAQRLVGQPPDHGVTSSAFAAAPSAPLIWFHHAAREDRTIRFKSWSGHAQTEAVESSEAVRSGRPKPAGGVASDTSRSFGRMAYEPPSSGDLDVYLRTDAPGRPTPSSEKTPETSSTTTGPARRRAQ